MVASGVAMTEKGDSMSREPTGRLRRCTSRMRRYAARHPRAVLLVFAASIGVAGLVLLLVSQATWAADVVKVSKFVLLILSPTLFFGAVAYTPRWLRVARRVIESRRADRSPQPTNPPIERIAADLRRLLWEHHRFSRSNDYPIRAGRLWALESAIGDCAAQAARALGVPHPDPPATGGLHRPQLRRLLRALAAEGLVLPPAVELLTPDNRF